MAGGPPPSGLLPRWSAAPSSALRRHSLSEREGALDHAGSGSRTLLTEPPSFAYDELAVQGLIEIEDRVTKFLDLIEDASDAELVEIVHEVLNAMIDGEAAMAACRVARGSQA